LHHDPRGSGACRRCLGKFLALGLSNRLLANVPPGKSLLVNVFWPAWEWGPRSKGDPL
jgi:hypothetical protein